MIKFQRSLGFKVVLIVIQFIPPMPVLLHLVHHLVHLVDVSLYVIIRGRGRGQ